MNLHWLLSQTKVAARPSVLWCYKKELGFTRYTFSLPSLISASNRKKRESKIKRDIKKGVREANEEDPFELFVSVTNIRYTYYKESEKILGNTYGMCVLQVRLLDPLKFTVLINFRISKPSPPICWQEPLKPSKVVASLSFCCAP